MAAELKQAIEEDAHRVFGDNPRPTLYRFRKPALRYLSAFRKAQFHRQRGNKFRYRLYAALVQLSARKTLIQIPATTKVGRGLYIGHLGPVIVNERAVLGDNVNLAVGVTIGQTNRGSKEGCPVIGNRVWIGTNAVVVGQVTIGDNVLIAPNSYVNVDVPANSIFAGNPGTSRTRETATDGYVNNLV